MSLLVCFLSLQGRIGVRGRVSGSRWLQAGGSFRGSLQRDGSQACAVSTADSSCLRGARVWNPQGPRPRLGNRLLPKWRAPLETDRFQVWGRFNPSSTAVAGNLRRPRVPATRRRLSCSGGGGQLGLWFSFESGVWAPLPVPGLGRPQPPRTEMRVEMLSTVR